MAAVEDDKRVVQNFFRALGLPAQALRRRPIFGLRLLRSNHPRPVYRELHRISPT